MKKQQHHHVPVAYHVCYALVLTSATHFSLFPALLLPLLTSPAFGRKRNAVAVALAKEGKGLIRLNGQPLHLVEPAIMRVKAMEPILLLGRDRFSTVDVRVRVKGGGQSAQIYAIRQSIAKAMVAYAQKCEFEAR